MRIRWGPVEPAALWDAYAVHRVDSWLRLGFQHPARDDDEPIDVTVDAYVELWRGLGLSAMSIEPMPSALRELMIPQ